MIAPPKLGSPLLRKSKTAFFQKKTGQSGMMCATRAYANAPRKYLCTPCTGISAQRVCGCTACNYLNAARAYLCAYNAQPNTKTE